MRRKGKKGVKLRRSQAYLSKLNRDSGSRIKRAPFAAQNDCLSKSNEKNSDDGWVDSGVFASAVLLKCPCDSMQPFYPTVQLSSGGFKRRVLSMANSRMYLING
jgi:hypothetical protein